MSTPKINIFNKFLMMIYDRNFCLNYTDATRNALFDGYLNKSSSLYFKKCRKDLTLYTVASSLSETFTATGSADFVISDYPTVTDEDAIELICTVDGSTASYTFTESTKTFTISPTPDVDATVVCGYNYSGEYEEDLSDEEEWILAIGMIIPFTDYNLYASEKMRDVIMSKDFTQPHSPANLIKELRLLREMAEINMRRRIVDYTYETIDFDGFQ